MDTDFAATVNKNKNKLDDMQVVMKKNKKKKVIVGATENAVFKGVCKKSVVCVVDWNQAPLLILLEII